MVFRKIESRCSKIVTEYLGESVDQIITASSTEVDPTTTEEMTILLLCKIIECLGSSSHLMGFIYTNPHLILQHSKS